MHQSLPDLLRNPVAPDLALHHLLDLTWFCTKASQTFSGTFSDTLLNLTWLCTKVSQTFSRLNLVEPDLALHQSLPDLLRNLLRNPVELDLALHGSLPYLLRNLLRREWDATRSPKIRGFKRFLTILCLLFLF